MPWVAPVVGISDGLGYIRCNEHRDHARNGVDAEIRADAYLHSEVDVCESCERPLTTNPREKVQVPWSR